MPRVSWVRMRVALNLLCDWVHGITGGKFHLPRTIEITLRLISGDALVMNRDAETHYEQVSSRQPRLNLAVSGSSVGHRAKMRRCGGTFEQ
jgi:hypothetical protein